MKLKIISASIIGTLVIVGVFFVFNRKKESQTKQLHVITAEEAESLADHVIKMMPGSFSPSTINIKKGETVAWINKDSQFRWPASNIHPTHEIYSEFDSKQPLAQGEAWLFTFENVGQWRFHDHLISRLKGTVIVEE